MNEPSADRPEPQPPRNPQDAQNPQSSQNSQDPQNPPGSRTHGGGTSTPVLDKEDQPEPRGQRTDEGKSHGLARRFWSPRRIPAALLALLLLLMIGLLLYDVIAVRSGREAMQWRKGLTGELGERPLDDIWVRIGAGVAAAIGLWLLLLALTPGLRSLLPMRRTHPGVRGVLHREAASTALRDRAMEVPGVQSAKVRMKRRRADVRVVSHFREPAQVKSDVTNALGEGAHELGLGHTPSVRVRVRQGTKGGSR